MLNNKDIITINLASDHPTDILRAMKLMAEQVESDFTNYAENVSDDTEDLKYHLKMAVVCAIIGTMIDGILEIKK